MPSKKEELVTTPEALKRRQMIEAAALIIIGIVMVIQQFQSVSKNAELTNCLSELTAKITTSTSARSEAAEARDAADLKKEADLSIVMRGRVTNQMNTSDEIQAAALDWQKQYKLWKEKSEELNDARDANPTPEYTDYCSKITIQKKPAK